MKNPSAVLSGVLFVAAVGLMGWLRLDVFSDRFLSLTYGLPLLVCLWHRDRRLLWAMALTFTGMSAYKALVLLSPEPTRLENALQCGMQIINIGVIAATVHLVLDLLARLEGKAREAALQNDELQAQAEELQRQNEEIQQQTEEMEQQSEEMQSQSEELHEVNTRQENRQRMLQILLESIKAGSEDRETLERICRTVLTLFRGAAVAVAVVERREDELQLLAHAGTVEPAEHHWPYASSFAALVMEDGRTAFVDDLAARPDLKGLRPREGTFRSVLASPLRFSNVIVGAVKVFSDHPRKWSPDDFELLEWVAAQCSLILEARRLQEELTSANARLEQLVRERTAELRVKVEDLQHFSYSITHDLRAPLRAMVGFAELLNERCDGRLDAEERDFLRRIIGAAGRMDRLITDSLSFARVAQEELPMGRVDPAPLLRGVLESYPAFHGPQAEVRIDGPLPAVLGNEAGLLQCFSNLLGNAVKFVSPGCRPQVRIRAENGNGRVRLWFEDNGIGIPAEMRSRIFGMFQRASKEYEGTGIGLALVRKMAERMGGTVGVESEEGRGSRFWLELRAAP